MLNIAYTCRAYVYAYRLKSEGETLQHYYMIRAPVLLMDQISDARA